MGVLKWSWSEMDEINISEVWGEIVSYFNLVIGMVLSKF